jgi:hypothetical protein
MRRPFSVVAAMCATPGAHAQATQSISASVTTSASATASSAKSCELEIDASEQWVNSNDVRAEEKLHIPAAGGGFHLDGRILLPALKRSAANSTN